MIKTIIHKAGNRFIAVLVRGDYEINPTKLARVVGEKVELADPHAIKELTGAPVGFSGPVNLKGVEVIADYSIQGMGNSIVGANKKDAHLINVSIERDFKVDKFQDIRYIEDNDPCPRCKGRIKIEQAIEVGHVFKLGRKYTKSMHATVLDENGKEKYIIMGCYGIGINRIMAAVIEKNNDENGIIWPTAIAPYQVLVLPVAMTDKKLLSLAEEIYKELSEKGVDVLLDDRPLSAGVKFKDADLIGIPTVVIIGKKSLKEKKIEVKYRKTQEKKFVDRKSLGSLLC